ncbi:MAG: hypothetical protein LBJ63_08405, partial [Prevotellaceae bacterium]|nr:hypothetical protein [Prevotellaceae bacterium]
FKFSKAETNVNREVSVTASSAEASKSGENTLKENNGGIWGISVGDANKMKDDIYKVLANNKFVDVRALIMTEGKTFKKVNNNELSSALAGKQLNADETTYINMVVNTINSEAIFKIEYLNYSGTTSAEGTNRINHYFATKGFPSIMTSAGTVLAATIAIMVGEGLNIPTENGSHSFVISGIPNITTEQAITSGHELFGHGIPSSRRESDTTNNANAIRTDNLIRRLLGLPQRDGADHAGGKVNDPYMLPYIK